MSRKRTRKKTRSLQLAFLAVVVLVAVTAVGGLRLWGVWTLAETRAELRAAGHVLDPGAFDTTPPLPDDNAALLYLDAFGWYVENQPANPAGMDPVALTHQPVAVWSNRETKAARQLTRNYGEALALLYKASRMDVCAFPVHCDAPGAVKVADLSGAGPVFRVAILEAKIFLHDDQPLAARNSLVATGRLLERLGAEAPLEYKLMAVELFQDYFGALQDLAARGHASRNDLDALMPLLEGIGAMDIRESLELDLARWSSRLEGAAASGGLFEWPLEPWQSVTALDRRRELLELAGLPYRTTHHRLEALRSERIPSWFPEDRERLTVAESRLRSFHQHRAGVGLCQLGLALSAWNNRHLDWPSTLESLTPEFLSELPGDPITGKQFRFEILADQVMVFSDGLDSANRYDDLGFVIQRETDRPDV